VSPTAVALLGLFVGAVLATAVVLAVQRRRGRTRPAPAPVAAPAPSATHDAAHPAPAATGPAPVPPDTSAPPAAPSAPTSAPTSVPTSEPTSGPSAPPVPPLTLRPHPDVTAPVDGPLLGPVALADLLPASPAALDVDDAATLTAAVATVADGGVLAVPGPAPAVLHAALAELRRLRGDLPVHRLPAPRPAPHAVDGGPFATLAADPAPLTRARVVLVPDAELHLRRGLDATTLARLTAAAPGAVLVLVVGACEHDASIVDDAGRWLDGLVVPVGGDRLAAAGTHDPDLDVPLLAAVDTAPLLADLAEAAAYARAAGRLPDVPLTVAARVATLLTGGEVDDVAPAGLLGAALAADRSDPPLLHFDRLDGAGLPVTVRAPATLVARCVADPAVLTADLLAVLLDDADPVERLLVGRHLAASERPGLAVDALTTVVDGPDATLAAEARLVRGVVRDRQGSATAADDYHAVATGGHGTLSTHGAFLLGGILETAEDLEPARAAYRSAVAAADPVHSAPAAFNLAWLTERSGDVDGALAAYRDVAAGPHPDAAPMAALNLATLLERAKRWAEAESWYRTAADAGHPDASPVAALALGLMLERRQRPREARTLFRRAAASGHAEAAPTALRRLGAPGR